MAGPVASVQVPQPIPSEKLAKLAAMLAGRGWTVLGGADHSPIAMDWEYSEYDHPDSHSVPLEEAEKSAWLDAVGWEPRAEVILMAACNQPQDHDELAMGAIAVQRLVGGLIDLGAAVSARRLRGRRTTISYVSDGRHSEYWLVDATWLEAWRGKRRFAMVK
jgi:hypothetical protein